jgi:hypothetical protein
LSLGLALRLGFLTTSIRVRFIKVGGPLVANIARNPTAN